MKQYKIRLGFAALAVLPAASWTLPAGAVDYSISSGNTYTDTQTLSGTDRLSVGAGGKLSVNKRAAINWNAASSDLKVINAGTIESTKAGGRTIDATGSDNNRTLTLENKKDAFVKSDDDAMRIGVNPSGGTIPDPTAVVHLKDGSVDGGSAGTLDGVTYTGTGSARFIRGDGAAIQMGEGNDTVTNSGTIIGNSGRAISLEGGDDTLNLDTGSAIAGQIDGGTDTINLDKQSTGPDTGTLAKVSNFEVLKVKGGTWTILDDQGYANGAAIASGATLRIGDGATSGSLAADIANSGALVFDRSDATSYAGTIFGTGSLTKADTGTLALSTAHSCYMGATTVSGGVLNIRNASALGAADGTAATGTTVASGAALEPQGGIAVGNEALSLAGPGVNGGGAPRSVSGDNSYAGAITLTDDSRITVDAGAVSLAGGSPAAVACPWTGPGRSRGRSAAASGA